MNGPEGIEPGAESRRETLVGHIGRREDGIASYFWAFQKTQHDVAWWLDFVAHILMPQSGCRALRQETRDLFFVAVAMNDMEAGVAAHCSRNRLIVRFSEMAHKLFLRLGSSIDQILRGKCDDLALGNQQRELILRGV